jgi:hypothetical protein
MFSETLQAEKLRGRCKHFYRPGAILKQKTGHYTQTSHFKIQSNTMYVNVIYAFRSDTI